MHFGPQENILIDAPETEWLLSPSLANIFKNLDTLQNTSFLPSDSASSPFAAEPSENKAFDSQDNCLNLVNTSDIITQPSAITFSVTIENQTPSLPQSLSSIEMFVQPEPNQRPCYASDFKDKPPRYIRGVHKELNRKTYGYPAIRVPDHYLNSNKIFYIRVTLTTVELEDGKRYVHPNTLQTPNTPNWLDEQKRPPVVYSQITRTSVDSNGVMVFSNLIVIKRKKAQLPDYGDLISFYTDGECPNTTTNNPKQMIANYQLDTSQLAFSVFEDMGQGQYQHIETIFSDVMHEKKEGTAGQSKKNQKTQRASVTPIFHDESLNVNETNDVTQWTFVEGTGESGWETNQKQYYTVNVKKNARFDENGHLIIEARKESFSGCEYTSARLRSKQSFRYGRFEIRAKLPSAKGTRSSFVLLPTALTYSDKMWPDNGEMNFMSHFGRDPTTIVSTLCTESNNPSRKNTAHNIAKEVDATTHFKTYTLIWSPDEIEMFVRLNDEDKNDRRILLWEKQDRDWQFWPFDQDFHLEIYLAVGGDEAGNEIDDHLFPQRIEIEYVRFKPMGVGEQ